MRKFYTLLFALLGFQLIAQITTTPLTLEKVIPLEGEYVYHVKVKNDGNTAEIVHWKLNKGAEFPAEWRMYLCDLQLCYGPGVIRNAASKPNTIPANTEVEFTLHVDPIGVAGVGSLTLQLYSDAANTNLLWETQDGTVTASNSSAVVNTSKDELSVYPNPADNYFSLKSNAGVSKVLLYNIVGKEVKRFNALGNNYFEITDLSKGTYLVRAIDNKGKIIKTVRLSKR